MQDRETALREPCPHCGRTDYRWTNECRVGLSKLEVRCDYCRPLRMDAYYYGFTETGVEAIDRILSAVAHAGKGYHHTESWGDEGLDDMGEFHGGNYVAWIQNAANDAARTLASPLSAPPQEPTMLVQLTADDVEWVVNDNAELGVKIGQQFFFCYKGHSLVYDTGAHDDGTPMMWRPVFKREFGECVRPVNYANPSRIGTVSLADSDQWKPLSAPIPPQEPTGASPQAETSEQAMRLRDELATRILCVPFRGADVKPSGPYLLLDDVLRVMERPDLGKALDTCQLAPVSPVEPEPPTLEPCAHELDYHNCAECVGPKVEPEPPTTCRCLDCEPLADPGPKPSEDDINRLEKAAWDSKTDRVLVWYRDRAEMFRQRLRETERAWQLDRKKPTVEPEPCVWREKYNELLFAVERAYPGESRHETALRYIREKETVESCAPKAPLKVEREP